MTMANTNKKARDLIDGISLAGDFSRDDYTFLSLARYYTNGDSNLMRELLLMTPLNRLGTGEKRKLDLQYLEYLDKSIEKLLRQDSYPHFDWSRHNNFKNRRKSYERI